MRLTVGEGVGRLFVGLSVCYSENFKWLRLNGWRFKNVRSDVAVLAVQYFLS